MAVANIVVKQEIFQQIVLVEIGGEATFVSKTLTHFDQPDAFAEFVFVPRLGVIVIINFYRGFKEGNMSAPHFFHVAVETIKQEWLHGIILLYPSQRDIQNILSPQR